MPFHRPRVAIAAVGSAIALFLICSPSQASECDDLIENINGGIGLLEGFETKSKAFETAAGKAKEPAALAPILNEFANGLDGLNRDLDGIVELFNTADLQDGKLLQLQQQYATNLQSLIGLFEQLTQGLRDMGAVLQAIATTPKEQVTPELAKQWVADAQQAEADLAAVDNISERTTAALDKIASDINQYCQGKAP